MNADPARDPSRFHPGQPVRRARRRATVDALLLAAATVGAAALPADPVRGLKAAALLLAAGLLLFLWRRGRDLDAVARARADTARALKGRGLSLADWHAGRPLPGRSADG